MSKIDIRKRNTKGCGIVTIVRGVRAEQSFWDLCDYVARKENTTRNELIIRVVCAYCEENANERKCD